MTETNEEYEVTQMPIWSAGEEWCGVTASMQLIGKKWHPVIISRLLKHGTLRFNQLQDEIGDITNKVLSDSLEDLQQKNLVARTVVNEKPVRVEYELTEQGKSLKPVIEALHKWGTTHVQPVTNDEDTLTQ